MTGVVYIHYLGDGLYRFRSYSGSLLNSAKVSKTLLPHHSAPRLGSVCPHSGFGPWAAAMGHPWPSAANLASCQVTHAPKPAFGQRGLTGRLRSRSKAKAQRPTGGVALLFCGSGLAREKPESAAFIQNARVIVNDLREQARSQIWTVPALAFDCALQHSSRPVGRCALDLLLILILGASLTKPLLPK